MAGKKSTTGASKAKSAKPPTQQAARAQTPVSDSIEVNTDSPEVAKAKADKKERLKKRRAAGKIGAGATDLTDGYGSYGEYVADVKAQRGRAEKERDRIMAITKKSTKAAGAVKDELNPGPQVEAMGPWSFTSFNAGSSSYALPTGSGDES